MRIKPNSCRVYSLTPPRLLPMLVTLGCMLALLGCQSLPDLSGFAAASNVLRTNVQDAGDAVGAELQASTEDLSARQSDSASNAQQVTRAFELAWERRVAAMDAFVAFSVALKDLADAGNSGEESAREVFASVKRLASSVDAAFDGTSGAVDLVESIVATAYGEIAKYQAHKAVGEAIAQAGPAIDKIVDFVNKDLDSAQIALLQAVKLQREELRRDYSEIVVPYENLLEHRATILKKIDRKLTDEGDVSNLAQQAQQVEQRIASLVPQWKEYQAKLEAIDSRLTRGLALLGATRSSLRDWDATLAQVATAVRQGRTPTAETLSQSAARIRVLVERWREL